MERTDDILALPLRARLFELLAALCRPASTHELADLAGRHHNTVRRQLVRLAEAGLIERRTVPQPRGRPRDEWAVAPGAAPHGPPPDAHAQLSRWLARAMPGDGTLDSIEATGREIGRELAAHLNGRPLAESLTDALAALGFVPRRAPATTLHFVLGNCPYREAVLQNQPAICGLHRGLTRGLLDRLSPDAELTGFVAKHPLTAGCEIEVTPPRRP